MHLRFLLVVSSVGCYFANADPKQISAELDHNSSDTNLENFIRKLLYTLQYDYQNPNWPENLQPIPQQMSSDNCSEDENTSLEVDFSDEVNYSKPLKKLKEAETQNSKESFHYTLCSCEEACCCDNYECLEKSLHNIQAESSIDKPKPTIISLKTQPISQKRDSHDLTKQQLPYFRLFPQIQINQFGTNKVEQHLNNDIHSKNQAQEVKIRKNLAKFPQINIEQEIKKKSIAACGDDKPEEQQDHQLKNSYNKQQEHHRQEPNAIISAIKSNIKYSDVDINFGKDTKSNKEHSGVDISLEKNINYQQTVKHNETNLSVISQQSIEHKKPNNESSKPNQPIPHNSLQPKVPDQPKIIIKNTTDKDTSLEFTTIENFYSREDTMSKEAIEQETNVKPIIEQTTQPPLHENSKIATTDSPDQKSTKIERKLSEENGTDSIPTTQGTIVDQEADGTLYYPISLNYDGDYRRRPQVMFSKSKHGVPIAYESLPKASLNQATYNNHRIRSPSLKRKLYTSPLFLRPFNDHFPAINHEIDYYDYEDDVVDDDTQLSHPNQYSFNSPAATVYWNSNHKPRHDKSIHNRFDSSISYLKQSDYEQPHSLFEDWDDWEPSYNRDMFHNRRPTTRDLYNY